MTGLRPTKLRREIYVNPRTQDFFKVVIEERKRLSSRTHLSEVEKERLDKALKVLANATSYGIYAEMNRQESDQKVKVTCHGIDEEPYLCRVAHPLGVDEEHFHLIAPYESDPRQWLKRDWIDQYSGNRYRITTAGSHGTRRAARVKTYGDVLREYEYHPEAKCADADGNPCSKQTVGLLQRRHIRLDELKYIGKESNSLEEVESGLNPAEESVYTLFSRPETR